MTGGVDDVDRRIAAALREDARLAIAELGRRVGLSRTAVLARVRRLEDEGVLRGYHAEVVLPEEGARHVARIAITARSGTTRAYLRRMQGLAEVVELESVAGATDLLVKVVTPDAARLDAVIDEISSWPETARTTTYVVLRSHRR